MNKPHPWFALTVKPRHEKTVAQILINKRLEPFLPLYRARHHWTDRVKSVDLPLFPGYIFCRFDFTNRVPVLATPGVTSLVGFGGAPTPVTDGEIDSIRAILASGLPAGPWPYVHAGQLVRIERGALAGLEGVLLREKDPLRVIVTVELLHRAVAVEIDREMVCAVQGAAHASMAHLYLTQQVMTNKPRNRVVVFRLSQDEYRSLKEICDRRGARNLSDFTRSEVLSYLQSDALGNHLDSRFASIEQKIADLRNQLNQLLQGAIYAESKR